MIDAAKLLADLLAATPVPLRAPPGGTAALTLGTDLFTGPPRDDPAMPAPAVFVLKSGGTIQPNLGGGGNFRRHSVQVTVRSAAERFLPGEALAAGVLDRLHRTQPPGTLTAVALGEPNYIGPDEAGRHLFTINFEVWEQS